MTDFARFRIVGASNKKEYLAQKAHGPNGRCYQLEVGFRKFGTSKLGEVIAVTGLCHPLASQSPYPRQSP